MNTQLAWFAKAVAEGRPFTRDEALVVDSLHQVLHATTTGRSAAVASLQELLRDVAQPAMKERSAR